MEPKDPTIAQQDKWPLRYPEPWVYPSNPIEYNAQGIADVTWPPVMQTTWNICVGMYAKGNSPFLGWRNLLTQLRIEGRDALLGPGAPVALFAPGARNTGPVSGTPASDPPTMFNFGWWPGRTIEMPGSGNHYGGMPFMGRDRAIARLERVSADPLDEITELGFFMVELPGANSSNPIPIYKDRWDSLIDGIDAMVFLTHEIDSTIAITNGENQEPITSWSIHPQRRMDLRGAFLDINNLNAADVNETLYSAVTINPRTDRTREMGTAFFPAAEATGYGGLSNQDLFSVDVESQGSGREIISFNSPAAFGANGGFLYFLSLWAGVPKLVYRGRVGGEAF